MEIDAPRCRSCHSEEIEQVLDLGMQPLANSLLDREQLEKEEERFALGLSVCHNCWLLQIPKLIPPEKLFTEYVYFSSNSDQMLEHARVAALRYIDEFKLNSTNLVAEIASNDGYMLKNFVQAGIPCVGIEPAVNIAKVTQNMGIETIVDFFCSELANKKASQGQQVDLILGNNVFAHAPNTNDFVLGLAKYLKVDGRIVLEFPYAADFIEHGEFDTIYHEHVFYFSLIALQSLFARHDLQIIHCERLSIHGGSLRLFAAHSGRFNVQKSVFDLMGEEQEKGIDTIDYYANFAFQAEKLKSDLNELIKTYQSQGKRIAAYGASAKGSTLLNYLGLTSKDIEFVVDRSPHKQGKFTPGTHLPILAPEELVTRNPDYALLLTWNFANEIIAQQTEFRRSGGKFIIPLPQLRIV